MLKTDISKVNLCTVNDWKFSTTAASDASVHVCFHESLFFIRAHRIVANISYTF